MIEAFVGLMGGGKTYSAVKRMCEYWSCGGFVASNIKISPDAVRKYCRDRHGWAWLDAQYLYLGAEDYASQDAMMRRFYAEVPRGTKERPVLVVIDEASEWFDALDGGATAGAGLREMWSFLRQSEKVRIDCIFITQDISLLQKRIRVLVQFLWYFRDMSRFRVPGFGFKWPFDQLLQQQYDRTGKSELRRIWLWKDKGIFGCYTREELYRELGTGQQRQTTFENTLGESMSKGWKAATVVGWLVVGVAIWRPDWIPGRVEPVPVVQQVVVGSGGTAAAVPDKVEVVNGRRVVREAFLGHSMTRKGCMVVTATGIYQVGAVTPRGRVLEVWPHLVRLRELGGKELILVPDKRVPATAEEKPEKTAGVIDSPGRFGKKAT